MMQEIRVQSCPRCGGAMYRSSDRYGEFRSCMNCGHLLAEGAPPPEPPEPGMKVSTAWRKKGAAGDQQ